MARSQSGIADPRPRLDILSRYVARAARLFKQAIQRGGAITKKTSE